MNETIAPSYPSPLDLIKQEVKRRERVLDTLIQECGDRRTEIDKQTIIIEEYKRFITALEKK